MPTTRENNIRRVSKESNWFPSWLVVQEEEQDRMVTNIISSEKSLGRLNLPKSQRTKRKDY